VKIASGSEQLTIVERIIGLTRLPYTVGCLLIAVATGPSYFLVFYLGSLNPEDALRGVVSNNAFRVAQFDQEIPLAQGLVETTLFTLALFLTMYFVRHWRLKLVRAQSSLSSLSPNGETSFHRAFGLVSSSKGALLVAFAIFLVYFPPRVFAVTHLVSLFGAIILVPLEALAFGTAFWVYWSCLWGLHRFGFEPLNLKRFYEDSMLGLRPLGEITTSLTSTFSVLMIVIFAGSLLTADIYNMGVLIVVFSLALAMLLLPLREIHVRMSQVKQQEDKSLRLRSIEPLFVAKYSGTEDPQILTRIEELLRLQALEHIVSRISVWPFETNLVERLIAVMLSVIAILLAELLLLAFHL
jgi:hypothetical protein